MSDTITRNRFMQFPVFIDVLRADAINWQKINVNHISYVVNNDETNSCSIKMLDDNTIYLYHNEDELMYMISQACIRTEKTGKVYDPMFKQSFNKEAYDKKRLKN